MAELRRALRSLRAHPHVTAVAVLSIGIGLGVNLAAFALLRGFFVQERIVPDADRLLWVAFVERGADGSEVRRPSRVFLDVLAGGAGWEAVGGWDARVERTIVGGFVRYGTWVARTTPGFHALEGFSPAAGRFFEPADTALEAPLVALLAHGEAVAAFGSPGAALGERVELSGESHTIVGVLPADAVLGYDHGGHRVRVPLEGDADRINVVVRLRPGVSRERAHAEIATLAARMPDPPARVRVGGEKEVGVTLGSAARSGAAPVLLALAVLLVAAMNLTTVLLSRGLARRQAIALRRLLGATRWALLRPLVLESVLIAFASGGVAFLVAWIGFRSGLGIPSASDAPRLSIPLFLHGSGLMTLVVLVGGCWPAFVSGRVDAAALIRSGGNAVAGPGRGTGRALGRVLVLQVAVAVPIVLGAGTVGRHAVDEGRRGVGYDPTGLVHVELPPSAVGAVEPRALVERVAAEGALESVASLTIVPVTDRERVEVDPGTPRLPDAPSPRALRVMGMVGDPLGLLGVPLLAGRRIAPAEVQAAAPVALVGTTAARALFGTEGAGVLGGRLRIGTTEEGPGPWLTVVGVVGDIRDQPRFQSEAPPAVWTPSLAPPGDRGATTVWARPRAGDLEAGSRLLSVAIAEVTGHPAPPAEITRSWVHRETSAARIEAGAMGTAAVLAILLCLLGLHGLTALVVVQRRRELAVRSALGASTVRVAMVVVGKVLPPVALGGAAGAALWIVAGSVTPVAGSAGGGAVVAAMLFAGLVAATALRPALAVAMGSQAAVLRSD